MRILYMDNYRGFRNTFLELKKVNFFLGDNSSGKTSVLSLISLLSDPAFPIERSFNTKNFELGSFNDIADPKYKTEINIGYIRSYYRNKIRRMAMLLLRFQRGKEGGLQLKEYKIVTRKQIYRFKIYPENKVRFYELEKLKRLPKEADLLAFFQEQISEFEKPKKYRQPDDSDYIVAANGFTRYIINRKEMNVNPSSLFPRPLYDLSRWVPPIRTSPKRFYELVTSEEHIEETPYLLNDLYKASLKDLNKKKILKEIEEFSSQANLFKYIKCKSFNKVGTSPFAIELELSPGNRKNLFYLGYGVSQSLPIITSIILRSATPVFLIQQPEVHLHPRAQATIGDLIFNKAIQDKKIFIIETHSDYIVDRFRLALHNSSEKVSAQVVFFERKTTTNQLHTINIEESGKYAENQPKEFREFFIKEAISLLEI